MKDEVEKLKLECQRKDELINSVAPLKEELAKEVAEIKKYKVQYKKLIDELRKMKKIVNRKVYHGRWKIVRWIIKLLKL